MQITGMTKARATESTVYIERIVALSVNGYIICLETLSSFISYGLFITQVHTKIHVFGAYVSELFVGYWLRDEFRRGRASVQSSLVDASAPPGGCLHHWSVCQTSRTETSESLRL